MIEKTTVETVYEYDSDGKLIKKTVTETKEKDTGDWNYNGWKYPIVDYRSPTCAD